MNEPTPEAARSLRRQRVALWSVVAVVLVATGVFLATHEPQAGTTRAPARVPHCSMTPEPSGDGAAPITYLPTTLTVPDTELVDQLGARTKLLTDVMQDKTVALNFVFTTCTGVCPSMGANFGQLQKELRARFAEDAARFQLVSISVDPVNDTPERLRAWARTFGEGPTWRLLTGTKPEVDGVLKALEVFSADKNDHPPFVLVGHAGAKTWQRVHGLTPPAKVADLLAEVELGRASQRAPTSAPTPAQDTAAARYFTDTILVDQDGKLRRFYSDVLHDKIVVIHSMFTTCQQACPTMAATYAALQRHIGARLGKDVHLVSITVDPENDTVPRLKKYAQGLEARPGWYFLTGERPKVDAVLGKLGLFAKNKDTHSNVILAGNLRTGLWKKLNGLAATDELLRSVDEVLRDASRDR